MRRLALALAACTSLCLSSTAVGQTLLRDDFGIGTVPDDPQNVRLNFWAPDEFFTAAYDASLQPVADEQDNEVFFYEVDWAEVRRIGHADVMPRFGYALVAIVLVVAGALVLRRRTGG